MNLLAERIKVLLKKKQEEAEKAAFVPIEAIATAQAAQQQAAARQMGAMPPEAMMAPPGAIPPGAIPPEAMAAGAAQPMLVPADQLGIDPRLLAYFQQIGIADEQGNVDINQLQQLMANQGAAEGLGEEAVVPPPASPVPAEAAPVATEEGATLTDIDKIADMPIEQLPPSLQVIYKLIQRAVKEVLGAENSNNKKSKKPSTNERLEAIEAALQAVGLPVGRAPIQSGEGADEGEDIVGMEEAIARSGGTNKQEIDQMMNQPPGAPPAMFNPEQVNQVLAELAKRSSVNRAKALESRDVSLNNLRNIAARFKT